MKCWMVEIPPILVFQFLLISKVLLRLLPSILYVSLKKRMYTLKYVAQTNCTIYEHNDEMLQRRYDNITRNCGKIANSQKDPTNVFPVSVIRENVFAKVSWHFTFIPLKTWTSAPVKTAETLCCIAAATWADKCFVLLLKLHAFVLEVCIRVKTVVN